MDSTALVDLIESGGFQALALALVIWIVKRSDEATKRIAESTASREVSFRDREAQFISLMTRYGDQVEKISANLDRQTEQIEELTKRTNELSQVVQRWIDRRLTEGGKI